MSENLGGDPEQGISQGAIKTYSLEEVAAMVLPPEMKNGRLWLMRRLKSGQIRGYKAGRSWRMTHGDVEDLIARNRNRLAPAPEPERPWASITARSLQRRLPRA